MNDNDPFNIKQQLLSKLGDALEIPLDANKQPSEEKKTTRNDDTSSDDENTEEQ